MRRKRRLPPPVEKNASGSSLDVNGRQIYRLDEDPSLEMLTPRSLAKSMTELKALRSRVLELELQLAEHQIEALTPSKTKLPPLMDPAPFTEPLLLAVGRHTKSTSELTFVPGIETIPALKHRLATAPAATLQRKSARASHESRTEEDIEVNIEELVPRDARTAAFAVNDVTTNFEQIPASHTTQDQESNDNGDSPSSLSLRHGEIKMIIGQEGEAMTFAKSQRNRLYQILKHLSTIAAISEDELILLKKLVDAEIGDVIGFLLDIELEQSAAIIRDKLSLLVKNGSPSKYCLPTFPRHHQVWSIQYPLSKVAQNLEQLRGAPRPGFLSPSKKSDVVILVSSGAYNPIHLLHIRALYVARQHVESLYSFPVVGAFISPSHDTFVRVKNRRNPREMITKRHRVAMIETAVASSSWIEVDKWEITRRRVLDYLSTLTHVREMCESQFPQYHFRVMYVCGCNTVVKLGHSALRDEGFGCVTVCRPAQTRMVIKQLGKTLAKTITIVEDTGVLPCDLECATSFRVRQALTNVKANASQIKMMVGKPVFRYCLKHEIGAKIAGKMAWTDEDKQWRQEDLAYVE